MIIGEKIKIRRLEKNLKQRELAELANISPEAISAYENGRAIPSVDVAGRIASALGTSVDDLLGMPNWQSASGGIPNKRLDTLTKEEFDEYMQIQKAQSRILDVIGKLNLHGVNKVQEYVSDLLLNYRNCSDLYEYVSKGKKRKAKRGPKQH
jgi:transcriptional regulator with XRE-family HTH domain